MHYCSFSFKKFSDQNLKKLIANLFQKKTFIYYENKNIYTKKKLVTRSLQDLNIVIYINC